MSYNKTDRFASNQGDSMRVDDLDDSMMQAPEDEYGNVDLGGMDVADFDQNFDDEIIEGSDTESEDENVEYQRNLAMQTQAVLLKTFDQFYEQESETMLSILAQSREEIKDSMLSLVEEQSDFKKQLNDVTDGRYAVSRKKENSTPLAAYIRRKRGDTPTSSSMDSSNIGLNDIALPKPPPSNITTDQLAVEKYMKKRERKKVAESNRINREKNGMEMTSEIERILSAVQGSEEIKEKERERQMERIRSKLKSAKTPAKNEQEVVNEILETYNDSKLAFEREKQQQEKRFQRIRSAKQASSAKNDNRIKLPENVPEVDV